MSLFLFVVFLTEGKLIHSMVAHLDSVTCLAVDPNGLYLMSGSKSSSKLMFVFRCLQILF